MPYFAVTELDRGQLREAWPVVGTMAPGLSPEQWEEFAERLLERGGGVIGVAAEDGGFHGIATYEPVDHLTLGRVLRVGTMVAFELNRRAPVRAALCEALDRLAPLLDCGAVAVSMPGKGFLAESEKRVHQRLSNQELDEVVFLKRLERTDAAA